MSRLDSLAVLSNILLSWVVRSRTLVQLLSDPPMLMCTAAGAVGAPTGLPLNVAVQPQVGLTLAPCTVHVPSFGWGAKMCWFCTAEQRPDRVSGAFPGALVIM